MLKEIAITPDVIRNFTGEPLDRQVFIQLRNFLRQEGVLRDLCDGGWKEAVCKQPLHPACREIIEMLLKDGGRHLPFPKCHSGRGNPEAWDSENWCQEALDSSSHKQPLESIVTSSETAEWFSNPSVTDLNRLTDCEWWQKRSPSVRLHRRIESYKNVLQPLLARANSVMFIDPHIDPCTERYGSLFDVINLGTSRNYRQPIEIHRVISDGSGAGRLILTRRQIENKFASLDQKLKKAGLDCQVYVWDNFHDRYLITNLLGILMPNGFDTTKDTSVGLTTWCRLGERERDEVQKEFSRNSNCHELQFGGPLSIGVNAP